MSVSERNKEKSVNERDLCGCKKCVRMKEMNVCEGEECGCRDEFK